MQSSDAGRRTRALTVILPVRWSNDVTRGSLRTFCQKFVAMSHCASSYFCAWMNSAPASYPPAA